MNINKPLSEEEFRIFCAELTDRDIERIDNTPSVCSHNNDNRESASSSLEYLQSHLGRMAKIRLCDRTVRSGLLSEVGADYIVLTSSANGTHTIFAADKIYGITFSNRLAQCHA
jgi:hypothetical protein